MGGKRSELFLVWGSNCAKDGVVLLERDVVPRGIADGADVGACMGNDAWEMKRVTTLCSVNGRSLSPLHAIRTDSAITSEFEGGFEEGERRRWRVVVQRR